MSDLKFTIDIQQDHLDRTETLVQPYLWVDKDKRTITAGVCQANDEFYCRRDELSDDWVAYPIWLSRIDFDAKALTRWAEQSLELILVSHRLDIGYGIPEECRKGGQQRKVVAYVLDNHDGETFPVRAFDGESAFEIAAKQCAEWNERESWQRWVPVSSKARRRFREQIREASKYEAKTGKQEEGQQ